MRLAVAAVLLSVGTAAADPRLTGGWGGARPAIEQRGFTVIGAYTGEVMGRLTGDRRAVFAGLAELGLELDLTVVEPRAGVLHFYGYAPHGEGLTETLDDLHGVSNIVAEPEIRLYEAWYDQPLGAVDLRLGLQSADQEFVVAPHGLALLNATFGIPAQASVNLGGPVYPVATLALRARVTRGRFTLSGAVFDGDQTNDHGIPTAVGESALFFVEAAWHDAVKVGAWIHSERADAVYVIFDHELGDGWASFSRLSFAPHGAVELYADAGISKAGVALGVALSDGERRELVVEVDYSWQALPWLLVQPDLQVVLGETQNLVVGLRTVIDL